MIYHNFMNNFGSFETDVLIERVVVVLNLARARARKNVIFSIRPIVNIEDGVKRFRTHFMSWKSQSQIDFKMKLNILSSYNFNKTIIKAISKAISKCGFRSVVEKFSYHFPSTACRESPLSALKTFCQKTTNANRFYYFHLYIWDSQPTRITAISGE